MAGAHYLNYHIIVEASEGGADWCTVMAKLLVFLPRPPSDPCCECGTRIMRIVTSVGVVWLILAVLPA